MGLDMYAYTVPSKYFKDEDQIDLDIRKDYECNTDFAYWRKFNSLHGWMENLYYSKGGEGVFNCKTLRLMPEDLDQLEHDIGIGLKPTQGFFFGSQDDFTEADREEVQDFIDKARRAIKNDLIVIYDSWW